MIFPTLQNGSSNCHLKLQALNDPPVLVVNDRFPSLFSAQFFMPSAGCTVPVLAKLLQQEPGELDSLTNTYFHTPELYLQDQTGARYLLFRDYASSPSTMTLKKYLVSRHFSVHHVPDLFMQLMLAVAFIHNQNIAHAAIDSEQIFITLQPSGPPRLVLSYDLKQSLTRRKVIHFHLFTGDPAALPVYCPPELLVNATLVPGLDTDIWQCGCILAEMMNKSNIFLGGHGPRLENIWQVIGTPNSLEWKQVANGLPRPRGIDPNFSRYSNWTQGEVFLENTLLFNRNIRWTASEILNLLGVPFEWDTVQLADEPKESSSFVSHGPGFTPRLNAVRDQAI